MGAKMGIKDNRTVVAVIGDSGFQMNIQELAVLNQEEINVKILILNNSFLGMVRQWQELFFESRYSYTKISSPDFVKVAEAYGIQAERVKDRKDLNDALTRFLNSDSSYLLEVMIENQENVFPIVPAGESISNTKLGTER
ncbi:hypothetical protein DJY74_00205 [Francisella tularensis]|nr:hypothetical protein [Francisella tularensis]MBZ5731214.1 hypothetical protein [Francisella tularensis]MBZ5741432.1 hypothetical protein [Francisella tularensis]MBZ5743104.1 hypothetical protein [Francisella tularensis]